MKNKTKAWICGIPFLILLAMVYYSYFALFKEGEMPTYSIFLILFSLISFIAMLYYLNQKQTMEV